VISVIVVEDDDVSRELVASRLQRAGYDVRAARSAPEARRMMADLVPDVLVSDMFMPGGSGLGLVADLRSDPPTADLPVVFLSGRALPADVEAGLALGSTYLRKPFAVRALLDAVSEAAGSRGSALEAAVRRRLAELGDLEEPEERALFAQLLASFAEQLPAGTGSLTTAVRARDAAEAEAVAHRLAGGAANLGAARLALLLRELEGAAARGQRLRDADLQPLRAEVALVTAVLARVARELA
jgi:CheY-like chemotaxis protein